MKKALIITSVASMIDQFLMPNIRLLQNMNYEVHVACNFKEGSTCSNERIIKLKNKLDEWKIRHYQVDFSRDITKVSKIFQSYNQVVKIITNTNYELVHCHSPIGGLITRLACRGIRKRGTKILYTAHGFHFYKGAPLKNWIIYYPIEKFCSCFTDTLITINHEDYELAKRKMKAKQIEYVPGVGIDVDKFKNIVIDKAAKRKALGIPEKCFLLISVGELNENKNQQIVIKAMAQLNNPNIHYMIVGKGPMQDHLLRLALQFGVSNQLHLPGFREDVVQLYKAADVDLFPSIREGLPVALMEAMASGLPCIASNVRGCNDLLDENGGYFFYPKNVTECRTAIEKIMNSDLQKFGTYNSERIKDYSTVHVNQIMKDIYERLQ